MKHPLTLFFLFFIASVGVAQEASKGVVIEETAGTKYASRNGAQ